MFNYFSIISMVILVQTMGYGRDNALNLSSQGPGQDHVINQQLLDNARAEEELRGLLKRNRELANTLQSTLSESCQMLKIFEAYKENGLGMREILNKKSDTLNTRWQNLEVVLLRLEQTADVLVKIEIATNYNKEASEILADLNNMNIQFVDYLFKAGMNADIKIYNQVKKENYANPENLLKYIKESYRLLEISLKHWDIFSVNNLYKLSEKPAYLGCIISMIELIISIETICILKGHEPGEDFSDRKNKLLTNLMAIKDIVTKESGSLNTAAQDESVSIEYGALLGKIKETEESLAALFNRTPLYNFWRAFFPGSLIQNGGSSIRNIKQIIENPLHGLTNYLYGINSK